MRMFAVALILMFCVAGEVSAKDDIVNCKTENDLQYCVDGQDNPITGKVSIKYDNGYTKSLENMKNGYRNGLVTEYDEEGALVKRSYYRMGVLNGQYKIYHKNRQIKVFANYKEGVLHGNSEIYDADGNLMGKILYAKGRVKNGFCYETPKGKKNKLTFFEIQNLQDNTLVTCGQ